jgi:Domain of unknown function (DUF397)
MSADVPFAGWRKSSHSFANGNCAEVAASNGLVCVRDSHDRTGPVLLVSGPAWGALLSRIRDGESPA